MNHRRQIAALFFLITLALSPCLLFGEGAPESMFILAGAGIDETTNRILWIVGALLLFGAVAFFLSDFVRNRRLGPLRRGRVQRLRVADVCALGNRQFVFVIECGEERHLIGAWANGIRHLSRLPSNVEEEPFEEQLAAELKSGEEGEDEA